MHRYGAFRYFATTPANVTPGAIGIAETRTRLEQCFNSSVNGLCVGITFRIQKVRYGHFAQRKEVSANG